MYSGVMGVVCPMSTIYMPEMISRAPKAFFRGTHRLIPPSETLDRIRPLMGAMGITRVANVTSLDVIGVPIVMVVRPDSRTNCVSQGKGLDLDSAKVSGVMESVEAFHAEHIHLPLQVATYEEFRREQARSGLLPQRYQQKKRSW